MTRPDEAEVDGNREWIAVHAPAEVSAWVQGLEAALDAVRRSPQGYHVWIGGMTGWRVFRTEDVKPVSTDPAVDAVPMFKPVDGKPLPRRSPQGEDHEALRSAAQAVLNSRHGTFAQIKRALDALDSTMRGLSRCPSPEPIRPRLGGGWECVPERDTERLVETARSVLDAQAAIVRAATPGPDFLHAQGPNVVPEERDQWEALFSRWHMTTRTLGEALAEFDAPKGES